MSTHRAALTLARCSVAAHYASLRVLATSALRASDGQRPGRECIFTHSSQSSIHIARKACLWLLLLTGLTSACFRHRRRPPCASSIRNGRPAAPDGLQYSLAHWAYFGLFPPQAAASVRPAKNARNDVHPTIRNGRPAAPDGLQHSLVHWAYYGLFRALRAAFVRPVISDESLVLPILCQCSGPLAEKICAARPVQERAAQNLPTFFRKWST